MYVTPERFIMFLHDAYWGIDRPPSVRMYISDVYTCLSRVASYSLNSRGATCIGRGAASAVIDSFSSFKYRNLLETSLSLSPKILVPHTSRSDISSSISALRSTNSLDGE